MRQMLSARKQGSNEPQDKYIEDLQNKFDNLELSEKEQVWFFTQGLRPDTQGEVLMRQPRTFQEAENVARLTQIVQQSIQDANGTDALSRIQQQLYALVFGMATKEKSKEAFVSAYQFSPTPSADDKLARLERDLNDINQVMTRINGHHVQDSAVAAYLPSSRDPYGRDNGNEISRLREENRQLKAALREPHSQTKRNVEPSDVTRLPQDLSTALSDIKRMQSRIDGFKRTYASKTTKPEQQRGRTLNGRPVCDICGRVGHVRQNCFSRTDQRNQSSGPQPTPQPRPRIAVIDVEPSEGSVLAHFNHPSSPCYPPLPAKENATLTGQSFTDKQIPDYLKIGCPLSSWIVQNVPSSAVMKQILIHLSPHRFQLYVTAPKVPTRLLLLQTQQDHLDQFRHQKQVPRPWRALSAKTRTSPSNQEIYRFMVKLQATLLRF